MKEYHLRIFSYNCACGHQVKVFFDAGVPQEYYNCRRCGKSVQRAEVR